jgi:hypothetical protein
VNVESTTHDKAPVLVDCKTEFTEGGLNDAKLVNFVFKG